MSNDIFGPPDYDDVDEPLTPEQREEYRQNAKIIDDLVRAIHGDPKYWAAEMIRMVIPYKNHHAWGVAYYDP